MKYPIPFPKRRWSPPSCSLIEIEIEIELIKTQMVQKPMRRVEVRARALRASRNVKYPWRRQANRN